MAIVLSTPDNVDIDVDVSGERVTMLVRKGDNYAAVRLGAEEAVVLAGALIECAGATE